MPELPEVETIVRTLRPALVGAEIREVWSSGFPLRLARPLDLSTLDDVVRGARFVAVRRRGKCILLEVARSGRSDGLMVNGTASEGVVLVHLGMSGRLRVQPETERREKHTHVVWKLGGARELRFVDPRRFGCVRAAATAEALADLENIGPDPLEELNAVMLSAALARSRAPLKAFLLDQRRVAGLGNIYVCEALFRARLHPRTRASRARRRAETLVAAIRETLELGIANRGTTLRDYVDADGGAGDNRAALLVYGREGKACSCCGAAIRRVVDSGRSTFYCARCQRR